MKDILKMALLTDVSCAVSVGVVVIELTLLPRFGHKVGSPLFEIDK